MCTFIAIKNMPINAFQGSDFLRLAKSHKIGAEIVRYALVGLISFFIDYCVLFLFNVYILSPMSGWRLFFATAIGYSVGISVNYLLSIKLVFLKARAEEKGKDLKSIFLFVAVGIVGLILTEIGMHIGTAFIHFDFRYVKPTVTIMVFAWNYLARKVLIFK